MRNGTVYPLPPSAPITAGTGFSSSLSTGHESEYPTPSASTYGSSGNGEGNNTVSRGRPSLDTMARQGMWPTPIAKLGDPRRGSPSRDLAERRLVSGRRNLDDAVQVFPTPTASNTKATHQRGGDRPPRTYLPTPTARDATSGPGHGAKMQGAPSLRTVVANPKWPTPTVTGLNNRSELGDHGDGLRTAVLREEGQIWPTPKASDGERGGRGDLSMMMRQGKVSHRRDWPTPAARDYRSPNIDGSFGDQLPNAVGGQLNPTWVEWLMGFPVGWTDSELWVTPLFPRSPTTWADW